MDLRILDCSQYIYAGSYKNAVISRGIREVDGEFSENAAPIGGVRFLVTQAASLVNDNTVVMPVFESKPTVKRQMYFDVFGEEYGYKRGRKSHGDDIPLQRDYARRILEQCGFPVQFADGYEADDLIYTLVETYKNDFEHVYVHNNDSDLYFVVDDNVSIAKIGNNVGKVINRGNYCDMVDKKGWVCYNVHHMKKLCAGDTSDNIPGIGMDWEDRFDSVIPASELPKLGDLSLCREYIKKAIVAYPTAQNAYRVLSTFNILMPLEVPVYLINENEQDIDWNKLRYFVHGWKPDEDRWGFEDELSEYINNYYR